MLKKMHVLIINTKLVKISVGENITSAVDGGLKCLTHKTVHNITLLHVIYLFLNINPHIRTNSL